MLLSPSALVGQFPKQLSICWQTWSHSHGVTYSLRTAEERKRCKVFHFSQELIPGASAGWLWDGAGAGLGSAERCLCPCTWLRRGAWPVCSGRCGPCSNPRGQWEPRRSNVRRLDVCPMETRLPVTPGLNGCLAFPG